MVKALRFLRSRVACIVAMALTACSSTISSVPQATASSPPPLGGGFEITIRGDIADFDTRKPLENIPVTAGDFPNRCHGYRQCGYPVNEQTVMTDADGLFEVRVHPGQTFLVIGDDLRVYPQPYAIAHMNIISGGDVDLSTVYLTKLAPPELAWFKKINEDRRNVATPRTYDVGIDEYFEEIARKEASLVAAGRVDYDRRSLEEYAARVKDMQYPVSQAAAVVSGLDPAATGWNNVQAAIYAQKSNCRDGSWVYCVYNDNTINYVRSAIDCLDFIGMAVSAKPGAPGTRVEGKYVYLTLQYHEGTTDRRAYPDRC